MNKILILFAHPLYEKSRIHKALVKTIHTNDKITFRDLYELYPDFNVNIRAEQDLLVQHDIIIWQHPFYWYSIPPLLKQWIDLVLEYGWAYGKGGDALSGKIIANVLSTGGKEIAYSPEGKNRYTVQQFLTPLEQTVKLCHMHYTPPFVVHGTHLLTADDINKQGEQYHRLLEFLHTANLDVIRNFNGKYLNELVA
jgi:glutathione-regulated potassium-efflux system ancillary protein KefG